MSEWKRVRLSDVCEIPITDGTHQTPTYASENEGIPFLSSKDVTSQSIDWQNIKYITKDLHEVLYKRIAPKKDDILLAKNGTTGVAALVEDDRVFDIYVTLALLRPKQNIIYPKYLLRVINSPFCKRQFDSHLKGIGVPNLHLKEINETKIPLPPLEEQKRIAAILDKCTEIIAKRKAQLAALDELIKARFVEMFGDPIFNSKGLPTKKLGEICDLKSGDFTSADEIHDFKDDENPYPCYGGNGIRGYVNNYTHDGDFPIIGRQGALCGNVQYATGKFRNTEHAVLVTPINEINKVWLFELLTLENLYRFHTGAAQPGLAVKTLNTIDIPIADLNMQNAYAEFYKRIEKTKSTIQRALEESQLLFDSLMQRYFG